MGEENANVLPCKSITTSILMRDFFGFKAGMASNGGTSEGCLGLPSISRRWKQHESWSTSERPAQFIVVKLGILSIPSLSPF